MRNGECGMRNVIPLKRLDAWRLARSKTSNAYAGTRVRRYDLNAQCEMPNAECAASEVQGARSRRNAEWRMRSAEFRISDLNRRNALKSQPGTFVHAYSRTGWVSSSGQACALSLTWRAAPRRRGNSFRPQLLAAPTITTALEDARPASASPQPPRRLRERQMNRLTSQSPVERCYPRTRCSSSWIRAWSAATWCFNSSRLRSKTSRFTLSSVSIFSIRCSAWRIA